MFAMVLHAPREALCGEVRPDPEPGRGEVRLRVEACAVCRTDLHLVDGELALPRRPIVPGHEIVGRVDRVGVGVAESLLGRRLGVPWLGHTCGHCDACRSGRENLCDTPVFTGLHRDGGYATHVLVDPAFCLPLPERGDPVRLAPLLCAGLIGWRTLRKAGAEARRLGFFGFGAAAHLIAQVAIREGREVYAFTRRGDVATQAFARHLGAVWAGASDEAPPVLLDAALIFAPSGELVPAALRAVRQGGRVVCGGIHMSDIPSFPYEILWGEREVASVANLTRSDGVAFMAAVRDRPLAVEATVYPLEAANQALDDLRGGRLHGAAVLVPSMTTG